MHWGGKEAVRRTPKDSLTSAGLWESEAYRRAVCCSWRAAQVTLCRAANMLAALKVVNWEIGFVMRSGWWKQVEAIFTLEQFGD